jgi:hypothetical protein
VPDILGILGDGAVRRELARARRVEDRHLDPPGAVLVRAVCVEKDRWMVMETRTARDEKERVGGYLRQNKTHITHNYNG